MKIQHRCSSKAPHVCSSGFSSVFLTSVLVAGPRFPSLLNKKSSWQRRTGVQDRSISWGSFKSACSCGSNKICGSKIIASFPTFTGGNFAAITTRSTLVSSDSNGEVTLKATVLPNAPGQSWGRYRERLLQ